MEPTSHAFKANAHRALGDQNLQRAMTMMRTGFPEKRALAIARLPEFDALRDEGIAIKNHVIAQLDFYLEPLLRIPQQAQHLSRNIQGRLVRVDHDSSVRGERALPHNHLSRILKSQTRRSLSMDLKALPSRSNSQNSSSQFR